MSVLAAYLAMQRVINADTNASHSLETQPPQPQKGGVSALSSDLKTSAENKNNQTGNNNRLSLLKKNTIEAARNSNSN